MEKNIQDFGNKIGGAKKDLWKERNLLLDDLLGMNELERDKNIKKDNVWKKPDYQALVDSGISVRVVYFIKMIRDAVPTKPVIVYGDKEGGKIREKQEGYIKFVSDIRDEAMNLKTEEEVKSFFSRVIDKYVDRRNYFAKPLPTAYDCLNNKLYTAAQVRSFSKIDRKIKESKFCMNAEEKILSDFEFYKYDDSVTFIERNNSTPQMEKKNMCGCHYFYPKGELEKKENWKRNTFFVAQRGRIIANNFETLEEARSEIFKRYSKEEKKTKERKKKYIPPQLQNIKRTGEDYRQGKDITGKDMIDIFGFYGGEFGNWLNDNDRQESMNFAFDAFMDLSKVLNILPQDISMGNKLSIAFGARGSGQALAHYEMLREVINLTKMKGAGSLAHEFGHAIDDLIGKKLGMKSFMTEDIHSNLVPKTFKELVGNMQYKVVSNDETMSKQKQEYERTKKIVRNLLSNVPKGKMTVEQQTHYEEALDAATNYDVTMEDIVKGHEGTFNESILKLSELQKQITGKEMNITEKQRVLSYQHSITNIKNSIGKPQKVKTEFYKNAIEIDKLYSKEKNGYWQNTTEMFARAFACFVYDKLQKDRNDYLCGHANLVKVQIGDDVVRGYPTGEEREKLNENFEKLFEELKERGIFLDYKKTETLMEMAQENDPKVEQISFFGLNEQEKIELK